MDVMQAIEERRAVRAYRDEAVDRETVRKLIQAAVQAPSAMNSQPWAFAIIQDRKILEAISDGAKRLLLDVDTGDPRMKQFREILASPDFDIFYGASTLVVICATSGRQSAAEDCALAGQNLMLAAHGLGLGTCPIGFARAYLNLPEVKSNLGIPADVTPVLPIIVGRPRGAATATPRDDPRILCWK